MIVIEGRIEAESLAGIRVAVDRVLTGTAERTITVLPGQANARRIGDLWTFYLARAPLAYHAAECGGSHPNGLSSRERDVLGDGGAPSSDELFLGTSGNTVLAVLAVALVAARHRRPRGSSLAP